ncbi:hypothetical protein I4U23_010025 [Adineta vaga]|nr:hypothetical protein I4U23_010025 [Adineta vaga]
MAAFGISFPKITLCRPSTSKIDTTHVPATASPSITTTNPPRTLSLSIKNVPSQRLHYDVSTTSAKKKTLTDTTILAIDGETKQLPKNLSVFNELQIDDEAENNDEKRTREKNSSNIILSSSLSPMGPIDHRSDIRSVIPNDFNIDEKQFLHERKSNQTFTPPTSSLSNDSSSTNDLHSTLSSISVDLPQLKYALEKFLIDDNDPVYEIAEEFSTDCSLLLHRDRNEYTQKSNVTTSIVNNHQEDKINILELHSTHEKNVENEIPSHSSQVSNHMKWYVSELRIHQPLIYRTQWINKQQNRQLSHSVNDLVQIYNIEKQSENGKYCIISKTIDDTVHSTSSLQNFHRQQTRYRSVDNILRNNYQSCTNEDLNHMKNDLDNQRLSRKNESVKKKLFDILNDDELENACLEDMSDEFEDMSTIPDQYFHRDLPMMNSYSSLTSSDDALYSSPPNELQLPSLPPLLSSSSHDNLSRHLNHTTEYFIGRSRLITTSLEKIPLNTNSYDHLSSSHTLRPSYENSRASWYTSPSPQWRIDDQLLIPSILKRHPSKKDLNQLVTDYDINENRKSFNHHRKEPKHVNYSLMNTSTPLVDDSSSMLPIIQDKSSNLLIKEARPLGTCVRKCSQCRQLKHILLAECTACFRMMDIDLKDCKCQIFMNRNVIEHFNCSICNTQLTLDGYIICANRTSYNSNQPSKFTYESGNESRHDQKQQVSHLIDIQKITSKNDLESIETPKSPRCLAIMNAHKRRDRLSKLLPLRTNRRCQTHLSCLTNIDKVFRNEEISSMTVIRTNNPNRIERQIQVDTIKEEFGEVYIEIADHAEKDSTISGMDDERVFKALTDTDDQRWSELIVQLVNEPSQLSLSEIAQQLLDTIERLHTNKRLDTLTNGQLQHKIRYAMSQFKSFDENLYRQHNRKTSDRTSKKSTGCNGRVDMAVTVRQIDQRHNRSSSVTTHQNWKRYVDRLFEQGHSSDEIQQLLYEAARTTMPNDDQRLQNVFNYIDTKAKEDRLKTAPTGIEFISSRVKSTSETDSQLQPVDLIQNKEINGSANIPIQNEKVFDENHAAKKREIAPLNGASSLHKLKKSLPFVTTDYDQANSILTTNLKQHDVHSHSLNIGTEIDELITCFESKMKESNSMDCDKIEYLMKRYIELLNNEKRSIESSTNESHTQELNEKLNSENVTLNQSQSTHSSTNKLLDVKSESILIENPENARLIRCHPIPYMSSKEKISTETLQQVFIESTEQITLKTKDFKENLDTNERIHEKDITIISSQIDSTINNSQSQTKWLNSLLSKISNGPSNITDIVSNSPSVSIEKGITTSPVLTSNDIMTVEANTHTDQLLNGNVSISNIVMRKNEVYTHFEEPFQFQKRTNPILLPALNNEDYQSGNEKIDHRDTDDTLEPLILSMTHRIVQQSTNTILSPSDITKTINSKYKKLSTPSPNTFEPLSTPDSFLPNPPSSVTSTSSVDNTHIEQQQQQHEEETQPTVGDITSSLTLLNQSEPSNETSTSDPQKIKSSSKAIVDDNHAENENIKHWNQNDEYDYKQKSKRVDSSSTIKKHPIMSITTTINLGMQEPSLKLQNSTLKNENDKLIFDDILVESSEETQRTTSITSFNPDHLNNFISNEFYEEKDQRSFIRKGQSSLPTKSNRTMIPLSSIPKMLSKRSPRKQISTTLQSTKPNTILSVTDVSTSSNNTLATDQLLSTQSTITDHKKITSLKKSSKTYRSKERNTKTPNSNSKHKIFRRTTSRSSTNFTLPNSTERHIATSKKKIKDRNLLMHSDLIYNTEAGSDAWIQSHEDTSEILIIDEQNDKKQHKNKMLEESHLMPINLKARGDHQAHTIDSSKLPSIEQSCGENHMKKLSNNIVRRPMIRLPVTQIEKFDCGTIGPRLHPSSLTRQLLYLPSIRVHEHDHQTNETLTDRLYRLMSSETNDDKCAFESIVNWQQQSYQLTKTEQKKFQYMYLLDLPTRGNTIRGRQYPILTDEIDLIDDLNTCTLVNKWAFADLVDIERKKYFQESIPVKQSNLNKSIKICLRKRPLTQFERNVFKEVDIISTIDSQTILLHIPSITVDNQVFIKNQKFKCDQTFDEHCQINTVYQATLSPLLDKVLDGNKCLYLIGGGRYSGKTSLLRSLIDLLAFDLIQLLSSYDIYIKFLGICHNRIVDLLQNYSPIRLMKLINWIFIPDEEFHLKTDQDIDYIVCQMKKRRRYMHQLIQINFYEKGQSTVIGSLMIVLLASSQYVYTRNLCSHRRKFLINSLNKTMLSFKRALLGIRQHPDRIRAAFNNDILTRLIQPYVFNEPSNVCYIGTLNPGHRHRIATKSTLEFARNLRFCLKHIHRQRRKHKKLFQIKNFNDDDDNEIF